MEESLNQLSVLVIGNSRNELEVILSSLRKIDRWPLDIIQADDYEESVEIIEDRQIDLLILDYDVSETTGKSILEFIQKPRFNFPLIVLSGKGDDQVAVEVMRRGADDYLPKSVLEPDNLQESMKRVLDEYRRERRRKIREKKLEQLARTDELTGLFNMRYFMRSLDREIERSTRYDYNVCLALLDVDGLQDLQTSDPELSLRDILPEVADVVEESIRDSDFACRYDNDDISIVLPHTNYDGARELANRLCDELNEHLLHLPPEQDSKISYRVGLAEFNGKVHDRHSNDDIYELLDEAEQALYIAKQQSGEQAERRRYSREKVDMINAEIGHQEGKAHGKIIELARDGIAATSQIVGVRVELEDAIPSDTGVKIQVSEDSKQLFEEAEGVVRWSQTSLDGEGMIAGIKLSDYS